MMFVPNYSAAKPESGLLKVSLVDSSNCKGSGDCFGTGVIKRRPGGQIYPSQELWMYLAVYMLSKVQKENNIPEQIKVV